MKKHLFLLLSSFAILQPAFAAEPRPNIVLVMADDQGWGDTGYNGHPDLKTPNSVLIFVALAIS